MPDQEQLAQKLWEKSEQLQFVGDMKEGRTVAEAMGRIDYQPAFAKAPIELGCSDGRVCEHRFGGAGDFILATLADQEKLARQNRGRIKVVKSHEGCGAAAIKFREMQAAGELLPEGVLTSDQLGAYYAKELAGKLGASYAHTDASEMLGPFHNERAIYLDGTGKFNPEFLFDKLPSGFMCSGAALGLSSKYLETELATLAKIALGDHGFGDRLDQKNPLVVVVSANSQEQLAELESIARRAAAQFNGRLIVGGFVAE